TCVILYEKPSKDRNAHPTYPLIFSNMWKHLFVDALLSAVPSCLSDVLERALNAIDFNSINKWYQEIELLQNYQSTDSADDGEIQKLLDKRLQEVLANADNGTISCLKKVVKESFGERKSLQSQFMTNLAQSIQFLLVKLLLVIFENRNIQLYCKSTNCFCKFSKNRKLCDYHTRKIILKSFFLMYLNVQNKVVRNLFVTFIGFLVNTHSRNEEKIVHLEGNDIRFSEYTCVIFIKNICSFVELAAADAMQQFER
ncbi:hypothetical protein RFI_32883, partial [Reticulomyxa filosa]